MSELATRAEELAIVVEEQCCAGDYVFIGSEAAKLIEQALLAERVKVWEEAAKIADSAFASPTVIAKRIRVAAEKEVGK